MCLLWRSRFWFIFPLVGDFLSYYHASYRVTTSITTSSLSRHVGIFIWDNTWCSNGLDASHFRELKLCTARRRLTFSFSITSLTRYVHYSPFLTSFELPRKGSVTVIVIAGHNSGGEDIDDLERPTYRTLRRSRSRRSMKISFGGSSSSGRPSPIPKAHHQRSRSVVSLASALNTSATCVSGHTHGLWHVFLVKIGESQRSLSTSLSHTARYCVCMREHKV